MWIGKFSAQDYKSLLPTKFVKAIEFVANQDLESIELGKHQIAGLDIEDAFFVVMEYQTSQKSSVGPECHNNYCDVQFIVSGEEKFGWAELTDSTKESLLKQFDYETERDICFIAEDTVPLSYIEMKQGEFYLFSPLTVHLPNLTVTEDQLVRKVVIKIKQS